MKKVGIIGGSGFIGSHITKKFLEENFKVKVSSTDISKREKYEHLKEFKGAENLEISELNIENIDLIKEFVKDCDILIHCGTPFQLDVQDPEKELFAPTVKGTENFLQVVKTSPNVKKVIFVASVASYNTGFPMPVENKNLDHIYTENDEPFIHEAHHPYAQAKYYADQTVRKFIKDNPTINFEILSFSPTLVVGKPLSKRQDSTSVGMQSLIKNKIAPNPFMEMLYEHDVEFAMVDVKDVAESIFKAAKTDNLHGKNYLLSSNSWKVSDISRILNKKEPKGNSRIVYSSELASKDLGIRFTPTEVTLSEFE